MTNQSTRWALILAAACSLVAAAEAEPAEPGLVARWTFDEGRGDVARDVSGYGHDAKLKNVTWVPSPRGGALRFESKDSLADYAGLETMNLSGDLTLAVWVKADGAVQANHHRLIFGDVGWGIERNLHLSLDNYQRLSFEWADGRRNASLLAPASLLNGAWRQVVVVADSRALRARLFVDGEVVAEMDMPLPISHAPAKGRITGWFYDGYFQGELDDIRLYSRALSTAEVTALFDAEADLQVGGATLLYDALGERPSGVSSVRLRNRGRQPRRVQLTGDLPAREIALAPGAEAEVSVGRVPLDPVWSRRSDLFVAGGAAPAGKLAVTTAYDGRDDRQQITTAGQLVLEPLRVEVLDPWQRNLAPGKAARITVDTRLLLPSEQLRQGTLRLSLASREHGREVLSRQVSAPQAAARFELDAQALPWGAYDLTVSFVNATGRTALATQRTATVLPGGAQQIRVLNNLVSELMDARARGLLKSRRIEFMNPRDGWVWCRAAGPCAVRLGEEPLLTLADGQPAGEAMRLLPAGRQVLHLSGAPTDVTVRAIPALVYNVYPSTPQITPFGANTWARLRQHMLPNCNMIEGQTIDTPEYREWLAQGKLWIANAQAPGLIDKEVWTPERMLHFWQRPRGWDLAKIGGIQSDEYYPGLSTAMILTTARSVAKLSEDPAFAGKLWIPFVVAMYGNELAELFMKTTIGAGWPFSVEVYEGELPTEAANLANLRGRFRSVAEGWNRAYPGAMRRTIFTPMFAYLPYCTTNRCPQADFRVHLDQQMQLLATEPAFFGLWGVQPRMSHRQLKLARWLAFVFYLTPRPASTASRAATLRSPAAWPPGPTGSHSP